MSEFIRKRVIKDLIDELADIDPISLEILGHKVIETLESSRLVHHGINKDHKPVGYTVDSFSQDFTVVGQYSTEDKYFEDSSGAKHENRFDKIEKDILHALEKSGDSPPAKIYLVSSSEELASFRGKFNNSDLGKEHAARVNFLDARELAKTIFQSSQDNAQAADFYRYYLPDFAQNLDNYEYYGRVPPACTNHQSEPPLLDAISRHFVAGNTICVLHGLSGSGKTQAAIDYVRAALPEFGNYLWVSGEDWKEGVPLTAIKRSRGGVAINVAGVFNSTRTLLVVDDLSRPVTVEAFAELANGFALGGRVLLTSQIGEPNSPIHLLMPHLSRATAFRILGEDEATARDIARQFVTACRFCPLILAVTRKVAELDGIDRDELYREVLALPDAAHGDDGRPIMTRILQRLSAVNRAALVKIANSGCTRYDSHFLTSFIGANARASLQRLALLGRTGTSSTLSVHDLICSAVRTGAQDGRELADAVERYVERHGGEMVPSVLRQIHLSADQLLAAHEFRGRRCPDWLTYALLQTEHDARVGLIADLHGVALRADMQLAELICIVDSKEAYSYSLSRDDRPAYYQTCADEYGKAAEEATDADIHAEMLHHQGKALRRCNQFEAARACFQRLLADRPGWHATYGQIAHMGTQRGATDEAKSEGEEALRSLINDILKDLYTVPLRVSLAALSRLRSYSDVSRELVADQASVKQLADVVALSALEGFDQFYEGFLALTSLFGYRHGEICVAVAEVFPDMLAIFPNAVEERQWVNACEALTNVANAASKAGEDDFARKLYGTACVFAQELGKSSGTDPFVARVVTKTFLAAGNARQALDAVNRVPEQSRDHWLLYQQAKAELALGDSAMALTAAQRALELALGDTKARSRLSIYYDEVSQCLEVLGRTPEAIASATNALELVRDDKYREQLATRLERLKQQQD
ncbi:tetratricopeptide repeat protein [Burkholderia gladioli]|uniref:tetratricopeptide repeat protein n=1 Tax=Burkholderia gladioli TaxID=28095 RepID=UPI0016405AB3|nr:tetratricopeptide repeat protein [Burkholderia gladioli]